MTEFGLTGGIGSGKSTVAAALVSLGAVLIDADRIVRELQEPGGVVFIAMVRRFGAGIVAPDGSLDRQAVADVVFGDPDQLTALNHIVHPAVGAEMRAQRDAHAGTDVVVVLDIPLLVKPDGTLGRREWSELAGIVVVDTDTETAAARLIDNRGFSAEDARARIAAQASREARCALADWVIDNSGPPSALGPQVDDCWSWMRSLRSLID